MKKTVDPWFFVVVVVPLLIGFLFLLYGAVSVFVPLNAGITLATTGALCLLWSLLWWAGAGVRIESNQWYERYFVGGVEYFEECWMLFVPSLMKAYKYDSRVREAVTGQDPDDERTVVAQIFLSTDDVEISGVKTRLSQGFILSFLISYSLDGSNPALVSRTFLDNVLERKWTLHKSVAFVLAERLADLVNQVFQPTTGDAMTIEDVINHRQKVNERLRDLLAKEMLGSYATKILSVLIHGEPTDVIPDGFIFQRNRVLAARAKSDAEMDIATRQADTREKQSQETQRGESAYQNAQKEVLVASQARETERIKLMALQAQAKYQDRLAELEMYRVGGNLDAELARRFSDDQNLGMMPGLVMLAKVMGLSDLSAALKTFLESNTPKANP